MMSGAGLAGSLQFNDSRHRHSTTLLYIDANANTVLYSAADAQPPKANNYTQNTVAKTLIHH